MGNTYHVTYHFNVLQPEKNYHRCSFFSQKLRNNVSRHFSSHKTHVRITSINQSINRSINQCISFFAILSFSRQNHRKWNRNDSRGVFLSQLCFTICDKHSNRELRSIRIGKSSGEKPNRRKQIQIVPGICKSSSICCPSNGVLQTAALSCNQL